MNEVISEAGVIVPLSAVGHDGEIFPVLHHVFHHVFHISSHISSHYLTLIHVKGKEPEERGSIHLWSPGDNSVSYSPHLNVKSQLP